MARRWIAVLICLFIAVGFSACGDTDKQGNGSTDAAEQSKLKVSVTFDAMKEFVEAVGKDKVEITTIIPSGAEAHDFEPKAQDLVGLSTANVFVYNGLGMEGWVEEALAATDNANLVVVEASKGADLIERETSSEDSGEDAGQEEDSEYGEGHSHGKYDPHLWLGIKGAQTEVENIKDALVEADPANKDYYEQNCEDYLAQLEALYEEYRDKFQSVEKKDFVTGHAAFGYLCRDFGLEQNSVRDVFAEGEPSAQQLTNLIEYCKENNITTIFTEEMVSEEVSQTLADEVGAKVEVVYTMENAQDGMTYLERMESNLSKIYDSLTD